MVKYENECMNCATPGYPCIGDICPHSHAKHLYCDECGEDVDLLYDVDGTELCEDCLLEHFPTIELEG